MLYHCIFYVVKNNTRQNWQFTLSIAQYMIQINVFVAVENFSFTPL